MSDDLWETTKLELQLSQFERDKAVIPNLGAVLCWYVWLGRDGEVRKAGHPQARGWSNPWVSDNMSIILTTRAALIAAGGFRPAGAMRMPGAEHVDLYFRLTQYCAFTTVEEVLVTCRAHEGPRESDFLNDRKAADSLASLLGIHASTLEGHPRDRARLQARVAARYLTVGDRRSGLRYLMQALRGVDLRTRLELLQQYGPHTLKRLLFASTR